MKYSAQQKVRIVFDGLRGEERIQELSRREGIPSKLYSKWSKDVLDMGKKRLAGNTKHPLPSSEATKLRQVNDQLKQAVAEIRLRNRRLKETLDAAESESLDK